MCDAPREIEVPEIEGAALPMVLARPAQADVVQFHRGEGDVVVSVADGRVESVQGSGEADFRSVGSGAGEVDSAGNRGQPRD